MPNPPNRPEPARSSASAAGRSIDWKFGFVGSKDRETGAVHLPPPARVSFEGGNVDDMEPLPMADATGTIQTFTIDRLRTARAPGSSPSSTSMARRLPVEICDTTLDQIAVGDRVEMTFRRLNQSDGISNYFWKGTAHPMSSHGIKDRAAIIGMGCTPFREHWDKGTDDLMIDAAKETFVRRARQGTDRRALVRYRPISDVGRAHGRRASSSRTSR